MFYPLILYPLVSLCPLCPMSYHLGVAIDHDLSALSSPWSRYLTQKLFFDSDSSPYPSSVHLGNNHWNGDGQGQGNGNRASASSTKFDELNLDRHRFHILPTIRHLMGISTSSSSSSRGLYTGAPGGVNSYNMGNSMVQNERVVVVKGRDKTRLSSTIDSGNLSPHYQQQHPDQLTQVSAQGQGQGQELADNNNNNNIINNHMAVNILNRPTTNLKYMHPHVTALIDQDKGSDNYKGSDLHKYRGSDTHKDKGSDETRDGVVMKDDVLTHAHPSIDTLGLGQHDLLARPATNPTLLLTPIALKKFKQHQEQGLGLGLGQGQGQALDHDGIIALSDEEEKGNQSNDPPHYHDDHNPNLNNHTYTTTPINTTIPVNTTPIDAINQNHLLHNLLARPTTNPTLQQLLAAPLGQ